MFVAFWAESSLHNAITGEASKIVSFTNSSFIEDTAGNAALDIVETVVLLIERRRCVYLYKWFARECLVGFICMHPSRPATSKHVA